MELIITKQFDMMNNNKEANRIINEKPTSLLQHAYNPVNWYPWSD